MKKLQMSGGMPYDSTGYLFSFAKSLAAALKSSEYADYADDIIASSGFAFRMWVDPTLCPSATSIWAFHQQKPWVENGGLTADYAERMWGEDALEEERRLQATEIIKTSVDNGIAAVSWDISGCEWGLITGYDDETSSFAVLKISGEEATISYNQLGRLDLPIMSVLTVTGKTDKSPEKIVRDTKKLAKSHLYGEEWCDNAKGLAAYDALIGFITEKLTDESVWNLEYMLGTYAALKWYAWKFFDKYGENALAGLYESIHKAWQAAFEENRRDMPMNEKKANIAELLTAAKDAETKAAEMM